MHFAGQTARFLAWAGRPFLLVVLLTHVAERWRVLPGMGWGPPDSPGHYLDLFSAITGIALLLSALICKIAWLRSGRD